jgi:hypothetical protein
VVIATPDAPTTRMLADPNPHETGVLRTTYSCGLLVGLAGAEPLADLLPDVRLTVIPRGAARNQLFGGRRAGHDRARNPRRLVPH